MDISVFDENFVFKGIISSATALIFTEKYQSLGDFELSMPLTSDNMLLANEEWIVLLDKVQNIAGIISIRSKSRDSKGAVTLKVKGNLCEEYLYRRICWGLYSTSGTPTEIVKNMINSQIISPSNPDRTITGLSIKEQTNFGESVQYQNTGGVVGENIEKIGGANNFGFRMSYLPSVPTIEFSIYQGTDRTVGQNLVPPCLFSSNYENILSSDYSSNSLDEKNTCLVAGEGEGINRKVVTVGYSSGKMRKEAFIDARDLQSTKDDGTQLTEAQYEQLLLQRGNEKLFDLKKTESFECEINTLGNIKYLKDYFLGDKVTIFDKDMEVQINAVISEVEHSFSSTGESLYITFGYGPVTLAKKIKAKVV